MQLNETRTASQKNDSLGMVVGAVISTLALLAGVTLAVVALAAMIFGRN